MPGTGNGNIIGFIVWCVVGAAFIFFGVYAWFSKKPKPMGFWANAKMFEVSDVKKYNRAVAKLFVAFGIVFIALGIPLLYVEKNSAYILLTVVGVMIESVITMAVYSSVIEKKYRKK